MAFDFQAAVAAASAVVEKSQSSGGSSTTYAYPLVYPQAGSVLVFRPLFNPASGQILRLVNRHEKVACYRTYGQECPICNVMQQVKDVTGQDPFGRTRASRSRGICFGQFISSSVPLSKGENKGNIQPGEIILAMFPWSVYSQINAVIQAAAQTPTGMDQAFSHSQSGLYLQITVSNDFKYTTTPVPYMTFPTQMNDDEFVDFLSKMPSLLDQVLPSTIDETTQKQVTEYADAIYRQYIAPRLTQPAQANPMSVSQFTAPAQSQPVGQPQVQSPTYPPISSAPSYQPCSPNQTVPNYSQTSTPPMKYTQTVSGSLPNQFVQGGSPQRPACFGQHQDNEPKCICCPCEVECMTPPFNV